MPDDPTPHEPNPPQPPGPAATGPFEPLLPPQMAARAEDVGVAKGKMAVLPLFMLAILAGAFIAMGSIFFTTVVTGADDLPWGVTRLVGGLAFCLGLILVVVAGAELFTGNNLLVMALVSRKLSAAALLRNWGIVYAGNFIGAILTAVLMLLTGQYLMSDGAVGVTALNIANDKCQLRWLEAFTRGIYCNALVCLAVWLCLACRTVADKILAILFPITAFVAAGFEHSVANMYFIPIGLFISETATEPFWAMTGTTPESYTELAWSNFFLVNLIPVTLGNIIGGSVFVGLIYWLVYRRSAA